MSGIPLSFPKWGQRAVAGVFAGSVLLALAGLAGVGMVVLDDYGVGADRQIQRHIGHATVNYVLGEAETLLPSYPPFHRFYGVVFEVPLVLVERLLGLTDSRAIHLSRHLLTHLFFLAGGYCCARLVYHLFHSRWLALVALLLFVLQPRLYAHSFVNTKDIPFLVMFLGALFLIHRAWRRESLGAFALCGVGVGVATNLRIMGVLLFVVVVVLRAGDLVGAAGRAARWHLLSTGGVFVVASVLTLYAVSPYLWDDPLALGEAVVIFSQHPSDIATLFQGELVRWPDIPAHYLPTWIAITTPPGVLLLSLVGAASVMHRGLISPGTVLGDPVVRFGLPLVACLVLPVAAVIVVNANLYNGWRQVYFLYAPVCLLAVFGLRWLAAVCPRPGLRPGVYGLAAAGLAGVVVELVALHPYQIVYFNALVDRTTPDSLGTEYEMERWGTAHREGLEHLLRRYPTSPGSLEISGLETLHIRRNRRILPEAARRRLVLTEDEALPKDFLVLDHHSYLRRGLGSPSFAPSLYTRQIYHNTILTVTALNPARVDAATVAAYRAVLRAVTAGPAVGRAGFDLYLDGPTLTWVKAACGPTDLRRPFSVWVFPVNVADLPRQRRKWGFERRFFGFRRRSFSFIRYGVRLDGRCLIRFPLPAYPIRAIEAGQVSPAEDADLWRVAISLSPPGATATDLVRSAYQAAVAGLPVARSHFALYFNETTLTYLRVPCRRAETEPGFFLHVMPRNPAVLTAAHRPRGFEVLDFTFRRHSRHTPRVDRAAFFAGTCLASIRLPAYPIAGLRTGQGRRAEPLWEVEVPVASPAASAGPGAVE